MKKDGCSFAVNADEADLLMIIAVTWWTILRYYSFIMPMHRCNFMMCRMWFYSNKILQRVFQQCYRAVCNALEYVSHKLHKNKRVWIVKVMPTLNDVVFSIKN
jgi:hypothetical protein